MIEPRTAVVVLNWRDVHRTRRCLLSLAKFAEIKSIIVVDNESDGSLRRHLNDVIDPRIEIIESSVNLGFSGGVNLGIRTLDLAALDYLLMLNNDAEMLDGSLAELISYAQAHPEAGLVAPKIVNHDGSLQSMGERFNPFLFSVSSAGDHAPDFLTWACVLWPVPTLKTVGMLDEAFFMYWEDVDYGLRCKDAGLALKVVPTALVRHELSASHKSASSWIDLYSMLGATVLAKKRLGWTIFGLLLRVMLRVGKRMVRGDIEAVRAVLKGFGLGATGTRPAFESVRALRARESS